jgi:Calponin homology (CH) domain
MSLRGKYRPRLTSLQVLDGDSDVGYRLPIPTDNMQIFDECRDGLILCKLINDSVPDTIDFRVLNLPTSKKPLNNFQITENNNIVITSAKAIGCSVVNIGSSDIAEGREHLILGLIWQIIRRGLLNNVDIKIHPELYRLCEDGETIDDLLRLTPDQILLRWFNYHLKAAGWHRTVKNFSKDVSDGENYTILLNQLKPDECSRAPLETKDLRQRAEQVLSNAEKIGCRKYLTPAALVAGNPRLNLAFVANLFNTWPGLEPLEPGQDFGAVEDFDAEGEREARVFTLWLNSLGVEPGVNNLFEDIRVSIISINLCICMTNPLPRTVSPSYKLSTRSPLVLLHGEEFQNPRPAQTLPHLHEPSSRRVKRKKRLASPPTWPNSLDSSVSRMPTMPSILASRMECISSVFRDQISLMQRRRSCWD